MIDFKATVLAIYYPKEEVIAGTKQFYILKTSLGITKGSTYIVPKIGKNYTFTGDFAVYQGRQEFRFTQMVAHIPSDPLALLNYACTITKGCGNAKALHVWETYGENYHEALKASENKLDKALVETLDALQSDTNNASAVAFLLDKGATLHLAEQAVTEFGSNVVALFKDNPYVLAELPRQSFKTIDAQFRETCNISFDSPVRVKSLLFYTINNIAESTGDTVLSHQAIADALGEHSISTEAIVKALEDGAFRVLENGVTTEKLYTTEKAIFDFCRATDTTHLHSSINIPRRLHGISLDDSQLDAIRNALSRIGLSIINGGAGCGKTTIIEALATYLEKKGEQFKIAAFAGKAAARIREATGFPASTIHSMLGYIPEKGFRVKSLVGTTVIIDEASMVPSSLMAEICKCKPTRLILVGDEAQLPPVGAGSPFHDLVSQGFAKTVTTCYRNSEAIYQAAYAVRNGQMPVGAKSENECFSIAHVKDAPSAQRYVQEILQWMDFDTDIIITPRNGEGENALPASVSALNKVALEHVGLSRFADGERIICLTNEPSLDVWNGTTGEILRRDVEGAAYCKIDGEKQVLLPSKYLKDSTASAYALTIHKSQGSQYNNVVIVALFRDTQTLFDRSMLYTAITRAKRGCVIVTDTNLFNIINKIPSRKTVLQSLFGLKHE